MALMKRQGGTRVDLHAHSLYSDGKLSPEQWVSQAQRYGVSLLALCDHDCVDGYAEAAKAAEGTGVMVIPAVELSAQSDLDVHIIGYGIDVQSPAIKQALRTTQRKRQQRMQAIVQRLNELGVIITVQEVQKYVRNVPSRMHVAWVLIEKGYARDVGEAFHKYLGRNAPAFIPYQLFSTNECIRLIRRCGGVAVWAHPMKAGLDRMRIEILLKNMCEAGLWGLEVYHPAQDTKDQAALRSLARSYSLFSTAGSDCHEVYEDEARAGCLTSQCPDLAAAVRELKKRVNP